MLFKSVADFHAPDSLASRMRRRRFALFESLAVELPPGAQILDVGGTPEFWQDIPLVEKKKASVTLLNTESYPETRSDVKLITGDAREMRCFGNREFDVVFSNSVIEHVGDRADQQRMASEIRRVGHRYFIQTPNRYFPLEPHFHVPFFQFFPRALRIALVQRFELGWMPRRQDYEQAKQEVDQIRLISAADMRALFPDATLYREKICGLTKSVIAYAGWNAAPINSHAKDGTHSLAAPASVLS